MNRWTLSHSAFILTRQYVAFINCMPFVLFSSPFLNFILNSMMQNYYSTFPCVKSNFSVSCWNWIILCLSSNIQQMNTSSPGKLKLQLQIRKRINNLESQPTYVQSATHLAYSEVKNIRILLTYVRCSIDWMTLLPSYI